MVDPTNPNDSPAFRHRTNQYPAEFGDRVPKRVRVVHARKLDDIVRETVYEYPVFVDEDGAVTAIMPDGLLTLALGQFEVVEWHARPAGYLAPRSDDPIWDGPHFKGENHYLTNQGYPLGTACWYVRLAAAGWVHLACGVTPIGACQAAVAWLAVAACKPEFRDPAFWPNLPHPVGND